MYTPNIRLNRAIDFSSLGSRFKVLIDNRVVAKLWSGQSASVAVEPGLHSITVSDGVIAATLQVAVTSNETTNVYCKQLGLTVLTARIHIWREENGIIMSRAVSDTAGFFGFQLGGRARGDTSQTAAAPSDVDYSILQLQETHRTDEPLGVEYRDVENPSTRVETTRKLRVTRTWTRAWKIELSSQTAVKGGGSIGVDLAKVELRVEWEIKKTYSVSSTLQEQFEEELTMQIPPASCVRLALKWKRIWQHGVAIVRGPNGDFQVPYKVVAGITFDQAVTDT